MSGENVPLTPGVARQLVEELFKKKATWKRSELVKEVQRVHLERAGAPGKQDPFAIVKKALQRLAEDGKIENAHFAHWKWCGSVEDETDTRSDEMNGVDELDMDELSPNFIEREIGSGAESVYIYFNPNDRELATLKNLDIWECKVGRTGVTDPMPRIINQGAKTALSHPPVIGLVIRTHDSVALEKALHAALRTADQEVDDSPGTEWFLTSPERVEAWYDMFQQSIIALRTTPRR